MPQSPYFFIYKRSLNGENPSDTAFLSCSLKVVQAVPASHLAMQFRQLQDRVPGFEPGTIQLQTNRFATAVDLLGSPILSSQAPVETGVPKW